MIKKKEKHIVQHDCLFDGTKRVPVGSRAWFDWLGQHKTFRYHSKNLSFSARKETKASGDYWYAYRRISGKLKKRYLGKDPELDVDHLQEVARKLIQPTINDQSTGELEILQVGQTNRFFSSRKITPPLLPTQMISRRGLLKQMDAQIVFITAPAGYGKTILAAAWCQEQNVQPAWVSLDEYDNSLTRFWMLVNSALMKTGLSINLSLSVDDSLELFVASVINEIEFAIERNPDIRSLTLVLDDYHMITDNEAHQSVQLFMEKLPNCLQVIVAERPPNRFKRGRLRTASDVFEINESDLLVSDKAGVQYLSEHLGDKPFPQDNLHHFVSDLEGWVAGLHLTGMILSSSQLAENTLPIGKHEYLQEFIVETVLQQQPPEIQEFLIKTSFLGGLNASLCEAVTGNPNSKKILRSLWKQRLFITKFDDEAETYQYQRVFSHVLQTQLTARYEAKTAELLRRAAAWNIQHGFYTEAVDQYIAAQQWDEATIAIESISLEILKKHGEDSAMLRWFQMLPTETLRNHTPLALLYVVLIKANLPPAFVHSNLVRIKRQIETWDVTEQEKELLTNFIETADSNIPLNEDLSAFEGYIPNAEYRETIQLLIANLNFYRYYFGVESIRQNLLEKSRQQENWLVHLILSSSYALNLIQRKRLKQSERYIVRTFNDLLTVRERLPAPAGLLYTILSVIFYERGKWDEALESLSNARLIDPNPTSSNHPVASNLHASCIYRMQGEMDKAHEALQLARQHFEHRTPSVIHLEYVVAMEGEWLLQQGDLKAVESILRQENLSRNRMPLNTLRAKYLFLKEEYTELLHLIETSSTAQPTVVFTTPFELELLRAMALYHMRQVYDAKKSLAKLVREFAREEIIRPFLSLIALGDTLLILLRMVYWTENLSRQGKAHIETIVEELGQRAFLMNWTEKQEPKSTAINVTPREKEILIELAHGLSNLEIAWKLNITESTVKTHINNIYRKFGVTNRVQSVQFAKENSLL